MSLNYLEVFKCLLDRGSIMLSPRYGLSTPDRLIKRNCARLFYHVLFNMGDGSTCTEFVYPECQHFDNDATSKIDDVLTEHSGLLHVLRFCLLHKCK